MNGNLFSLFQSDPVVHSKIASSTEYSSVFKIVVTRVKESDQRIVDNSCKFSKVTDVDCPCRLNKWLYL